MTVGLRSHSFVTNEAKTAVAHITDIFSLAVTPTQIISASGSSGLKVHSTADPDYPIEQTLEQAHSLGCHHLAASKTGLKLASAGFDGEVKIWASVDGPWAEEGKIVGGHFFHFGGLHEEWHAN